MILAVTLKLFTLLRLVQIHYTMFSHAPCPSYKSHICSGTCWSSWALLDSKASRLFAVRLETSCNICEIIILRWLIHLFLGQVCFSRIHRFCSPVKWITSFIKRLVKTWILLSPIMPLVFKSRFNRVSRLNWYSTLSQGTIISQG